MDVNNLTLPEGYQMPFSLEAEQAVLGCVLMDPNCMPQVLIYLRPEYFYLPQHKEIFSVMVSLDALGNKIDPLIILETLKNNGTYDEAAGKNYLFQLAQSVPTTSNVESYAKIVREKYFMRTLITVSQETIDNAVAQTDSADMLLDAAEQRIYDIRQGKTSTGPSKLSDIIVNQVYDTLQKLSSEGAEAFKGISTGYRDLDDVIAGLNKSDLILIGARPAMGKTSFALNIARNVAVKAKKKILFFSLEMTKEQLELIANQLATIKERSPFYAKKFEGIDVADVRTQADFEKLPFSEKDDLRAVYPLGLQAVPDEEVVRIHSSSGTTGTPVIIPYTQQDVIDWATQFARCYEMAGITPLDRIQITPGYGLWTAGIGFQLGAERLGAMAIPMGPGNTEKQLKMMQDLKSTVICATSSYALLLAEEITKRNLRDKIHLKKGVIGSERWGEKMRNRIQDELGIEIYDIYGLTEVYGPGIGISCDAHDGMHIWDDFVYIEIVDPETGEVLPDGQEGELVLTTLRKQGAPLIRYRTHDLTRIVPGTCACGSRHPRIATLTGRTDDMFKVKGCNMFPAQVEEVIKATDGTSSEYQVMIEAVDGHDVLTVLFETPLEGEALARCEEELALIFKAKLGCTPEAKGVPMGELPRSEKKTKRIFDSRY